MFKIKYVIIEGKGAIIFSDVFQHAEFMKQGKIVGAGFVSIGVRNRELTVSVYGKSVSLNIQSKEEDLFWVKKALGMFY